MKEACARNTSKDLWNGEKIKVPSQEGREGEKKRREGEKEKKETKDAMEMLH